MFCVAVSRSALVEWNCVRREGAQRGCEEAKCPYVPQQINDATQCIGPSCCSLDFMFGVTPPVQRDPDMLLSKETPLVLPSTV